MISRKKCKKEKTKSSSKIGGDILNIEPPCEIDYPIPGKAFSEFLSEIETSKQKSLFRHSPVKVRLAGKLLPSQEKIPLFLVSHEYLNFREHHTTKTLPGSIAAVRRSDSGLSVNHNHPFESADYSETLESYTEKCYSCSGRGRSSCSNCGGSGKVTVQSGQGGSSSQSSGASGSQKTCPSCSGSGTALCSHCNGSGVVHIEKILHHEYRVVSNKFVIPFGKAIPKFVRETLVNESRCWDKWAADTTMPAVIYKENSQLVTKLEGIYHKFLEKYRKDTYRKLIRHRESNGITGLMVTSYEFRKKKFPFYIAGDNKKGYYGFGKLPISMGKTIFAVLFTLISIGIITYLIFSNL
ncbi:MAG: hypothetical protein JSV88_10525 [Candidatus Aminicenantes bacterium]|nr:MAG: hypothetical protein JSV88_10525 [Candidatus Aminicenantes bacterium]